MLIVAGTIGAHRLRKESTDPLRRLDKMAIGKVGVARRGPVPPIAEQLPDQRQVLARHDGLTGCRVPQVMQVKVAEIRIFADRPPARGKAVCAPTLGVAQERERAEVTRTGKRLDMRPRGLAERHRARAGLRYSQVQRISSSGASRRRSSPPVKSLDSFEFRAIPSVNKARVLELARCEWIERRENVIALGTSGTGKSHVAQGLGLAACQRGMSVRFVTAAALVHELMEARDERRLVRLQEPLANHKLLIIDELGFVPLSKTGAELLFELVSQRYERAAVLIASNLPFDEWTETFGSERLTGALLDRLTHHVHILEMNGESFRLNHRRARKTAPTG